MKRFVKLIGENLNSEIYIRADKVTSIADNGGGQIVIYVIDEEAPYIVSGNIYEVVCLIDEAL